MTLVDLIVNRGEDALQELPSGIRNNPEAMAETIENNVRKVIIDGDGGQSEILPDDAGVAG